MDQFSTEAFLKIISPATLITVFVLPFLLMAAKWERPLMLANAIVVCFILLVLTRKILLKFVFTQRFWQPEDGRYFPAWQIFVLLVFYGAHLLLVFRARYRGPVFIWIRTLAVSLFSLFFAANLYIPVTVRMPEKSLIMEDEGARESAKKMLEDLQGLP